ncbi:excisionase and transcriptional regulator [Gordonia phage Obliviate]|uniref:excisionase and transcriptional regulator n=1 Tax=Gordonia phage Obliviate TaxID=1821559 RepID=UPI00078BA573|nr:excisionase and transcriptional regulator [Gordonia phage Obliviate]AMS03118.1 helix-turn-helix DNA binding protein [Gordonia phage Obliviate]
MQTKHAADDRLSVGEAAGLIGISVDTLKRWERAGRISSTRTPTGHRRFRRSDVEALLTDQAESA